MSSYSVEPPVISSRREPRLVTVIKRLAELEGAAFLSETQGHELNQLRLELEKHWPEVGTALALAYIGVDRDG